jgi:predicted DNA-binding transcriptional regulator AlpA
MQSQTQAESRRASMPALDDDALLNSAQVKARCGNVSDMCIWRWLRDDRVQFPQPVQINKRNYWRLGDLRAWQAKHTNKVAA